MTEYEKDLNELKEQILKEGDTLVTKRGLLERFCEMDKEYNGEPWNLLQILANINILIGTQESFKAYVQQVRAERDIAIEQLNELGYSLGEKIRYCDDCVSRKDCINAIENTDCELSLQAWKEITNNIILLPSVAPKGVTVTDFVDKCRECGKLKKRYEEKN